MAPGPLRMVHFFGHTREWWIEAIRFYNRLHGTMFPENIFDAVERGGVMDEAMHLDALALTVLGYWEANSSFAELVLPEN